MTLNKATAIGFTAFTILLSGCGVNTYSTAEPVSNRGTEKVIRNPGLNRNISVLATRIDDQEGVLVAQATIRNLSDSDRDVAYRFDWFDGDGVATGGRSGRFRSLKLRGGETSDITSAAPDGSTDFRLTLSDK